MAAGGLSSSTKRGYHEEDIQPQFLRHTELKRDYSCAICDEITVDSCQTVCGSRACKLCIDEIFAGKGKIECPLSHDSDGELAECQQGGLDYKKHIVADMHVRRILSRQLCICPNSEYGCNETPAFIKYKEHRTQCLHKPEVCPNKGCTEKCSSTQIADHLARCQLTLTVCEYCKKTYKLGELPKHHNMCDKVYPVCSQCKKTFTTRNQLTVHHQIHPECLAGGGKCYYYDHCGFESSTADEMAKHIRESAREHLEMLTAAVEKWEKKAEENEGLSLSSFKAEVNRKARLFETLLAEVQLKAQRLNEVVDTDTKASDELLESMRHVVHLSNDLKTLDTHLTEVELKVGDTNALAEMVKKVEKQSESIYTNTTTAKNIRTRLQVNEGVTYEGLLIWRITCYWSRKSKAISAAQTRIRSNIFYTSRTGYKMVCEAALNGEGKGKGTHISLFLGLLCSEFDDINQFPFQRKVTVSILSPKDSSQNIEYVIQPDAHHQAFQKPAEKEDHMYPMLMFAVQRDLETDTYLTADSLFVKVKVDADSNDSN